MTDLTDSRAPANRLFYGWIMVALTIVLGVTTFPGQTVGVAEFNKFFLEDLDLNRTRLSGAYTLATVLAGLTAMVAGAAMDRYGLRRSIIVVVVLMAGACAFASQVVGLWSVFFAYLLLRVFGHGALPILASNTLAMWFHKRLGLVTGITGVIGSILTAGVPAAYIWLITACGWRGAWGVLGLVALIVTLPLAIVLYRNRPADVGQQMDGMAEAAGDEIGSTDRSAEQGLDVRGAMRTRAYWILLGLSAAHGMIFAAVMYHRVQIFEARGLPHRHSAEMVAVVSILTAAAQLVAGFLADRLRLHLMVAVSSLVVAVSLGLLARLDGVAFGLAFGAMYGLGTGIEIVGRNTIWPRYFGRRHLGKIRGSAITATVIGSGLGAFLPGWTYDRMGSYEPAIWILAGVYAAVAVAMPCAAKPRDRDDARRAEAPH